MQLLFRLAKPRDVVFDYLTDMQKFVSVHPVISRMDRTGADSYRVHETLTFGSVPFSFTYPVTVGAHPAEGAVVMRAVVMRLVKIEIRFVLKADGGWTNVQESIRFQSPLPVKPLMRAIFRKQHGELFRNIGSRAV